MTFLLVLLGCIGLQPVPEGSRGPTAIGDVSVSLSAVDFGEVELGSSAEERLVLTNTGRSSEEVSAVVTGTGFSANLTAISLVGDGEEVITLTFEPDGEGAFTGDLALTVGEDAISVPLSGSGVRVERDTADGEGGELSADQPSLSFGTLDLYASSMMQVSVTNTGSGPLTVDSVITTDGAFTLGGNLTPPRTLDPGEERVVEVTFTPSVAKNYSANLELASDDPNGGTTRIALSGKGEDRCDICSPLITVDTGGPSDYAIDDFLSIFGSKDTRTVTIGNDGDEDLVVSGIAVNNDFILTCGNFALGGWGGSETVAPGRETTFTITYKATDPCLDAPVRELDVNVAHIYSNDPVESDYVIELSGVGL